MVNMELGPDAGLPFPAGSLYQGAVALPHAESSIALAGYGNKELPNGHGILTTSDGQKYEGNFEDGLPHGQLTWNDSVKGMRYVGEWVKGVRHGQGVMQYKGGETYVGDFENDKRVLGSLQVGATTYSGSFDGRPLFEVASAIIPKKTLLEELEEAEEAEGKERSKPAGQDEAEGEEAGRSRGLSSMVWEDGTHYVGEWVKGFRHGRGSCKWIDGSEYAGQWLRGQANGPGKFTWPGGAWYHGEHLDGVRHGKGKMVYQTGECYEGDWQVRV